MTDYVQEQEMEIEALEAILMDDFKEIHSGESGLNTSNRCFQVTLSPQDDEADESVTTPVQLALIFSHTEKYPDEPPLLNVKSLRGIPAGDLKILKEKLEQEASENLGMAMVYTLVTSVKEWLCERFCQDDSATNAEEDDTEKDDVIVPHGEPVTVDTFLAWRERFEAELALERAKKVRHLSLKDLTRKMWKTLNLTMTLKTMKKICLSTILLRNLIHPLIPPESSEEYIIPQKYELKTRMQRSHLYHILACTIPEKREREEERELVYSILSIFYKGIIFT
ncbi:uncharacterized protein LOC131164029 isoform X2 [Malania oleifera]|uniref:uncharacterized protein LOC131164029 isoform X2 n=1 Tax=Malania oleifera TaxID=397392 RepID=UPI0025AE3446|nr:uncharacterized protein LOC131164029 isoform X2 [Malania oleifera]